MVFESIHYPRVLWHKYEIQWFRLKKKIQGDYVKLAFALLIIIAEVEWHLYLFHRPVLVQTLSTIKRPMEEAKPTSW